MGVRRRTPSEGGRDPPLPSTLWKVTFTYNIKIALDSIWFIVFLYFISEYATIFTWLYLCSRMVFVKKQTELKILWVYYPRRRAPVTAGVRRLTPESERYFFNANL